MPAFTYNTAAGDLTIGGIAMNGAGWKVLNLIELWMPADQRGRDRLIPGTNGVLAFKRRDTVTRRSLFMLFNGTTSYAGAEATDRYETLQLNIDYFRTNVVAPTGATDGTRSAVLTMPDGTTRTEPVHVEGLELGDYAADARWARAVLSLSIPSGRIQ
jgi:hypothetical protein